jgi:hypothetical protein
MFIGFLVKKNYKKRVIFYLSIDVENRIQQDLRKVIDHYSKVLKVS